MTLTDLTLSKGQNYACVNSNGTPSENGAALLAAYNAAKIIAPNGQAKSKENRYSIFLAPGKYHFNVDPFVMNFNFIDIIGVDPNNTIISTGWLQQPIPKSWYGDIFSLWNDGPGGQMIAGVSGTIDGLTSIDAADKLMDANSDATIVFITASDVIVKGVDIRFKHSGVGSGLIFENCILRSFSGTSIGSSYIGTAATYIDCKLAGTTCIGEASGTFINCTGIIYKGGNDYTGFYYANSSIFSNSVCSGLFVNCRAKSGVNLDSAGFSAIGIGYSNRSFNGDCTGKFVNCIIEGLGFASANDTVTGTVSLISGVFTNTKSVALNTSVSKNITGQFIGCIAGANSFGGVSAGTNSGIFISCIAGANSFGTLNSGSTAKKMACLHNGAILNQTV